MRAHVRLVEYRRGIRPDNTADGHEEPIGDLLAARHGAEENAGTDPKVAPDMAMYCPSVLMMPLGPAPYLKMVVVPAI